MWLVIVKSNLYGVSGLFVATLLLLALGNWPYSYFQFVRFTTCAFSVAVIYRQSRIGVGGWLLFAVVGGILFNPMFPITLDKGNWSDVDLVFAIGFAVFGIQSMTKILAKPVSIIIVVVLVSVVGLEYYVNHYMAHGPSYATGDVVCQNDDRGPCGEEYREDMTALAIPDWAKTLRENFNLVVILLILAGVGVSIVHSENYE